MSYHGPTDVTRRGLPPADAADQRSLRILRFWLAAALASVGLLPRIRATP
jgi:hypothetical protein